MTHTHKVILFLLIIAVISAGIGTLLYYQKSSSHQPDIGAKADIADTQADTQANASASDRGTTDEESIVITTDVDTSGWEVYEDDEFGFVVQFPVGWGAIKYRKGEPLRDSIINTALIEVKDRSGSLAFFIVVDDRFEDIDDSNLTSKFERNYLGSEFQKEWVIEKIRISGIDTKKYSSNTMNRVIVPMRKDDFLIVVYWNLTFTNLEARPEEIFNAILGTIQL